MLLILAAFLVGCGDAEGGPGGGSTPTVLSVTVTPNPVNVGQGRTQQFSAAVTGTNSPAQTVTWTVTGGGTGTSISDGGLLTVVVSEAVSTTLTVTATSTVDTTKSGTATVTVTAPPTVSSVTVTPNPASVGQGGTQQFSAAVAGTNSPAQTVTWTVTGGGTGTSINNSGLLTVAGGQGTGTLTVTATSTVDTTKSGSAVVTVTVPPTVSSVTVTPNTINVEQGGTQQFSAAVNGTNSPAQTVTWTVAGGITGTSISSNGLLTVAAGQSTGTLTVTATSTVNTTKSGSAVVTVTLPVVTNAELYIGEATTAVADISTLTEALTYIKSNAVNDTVYTIKLTADAVLAPTTLNAAAVNNKTEVIIKLEGSGAERKISLSGNGALFTINFSNRYSFPYDPAVGPYNYKPNLSLGNNITLLGKNNNNSALVVVQNYGVLQMESGAKISGNHNKSTGSYADAEGGGVMVEYSATFTMNGGEISDNFAETGGNNGSAYGGGVFNYRGRFLMNGGIIRNNRAKVAGSVSQAEAEGAGVCNDGTFLIGGTAIIEPGTGTDTAQNQTRNTIFLKLNGDIQVKANFTGSAVVDLTAEQSTLAASPYVTSSRAVLEGDLTTALVNKFTLGNFQYSNNPYTSVPITGYHIENSGTNIGKLAAN
ncbi:Ig-like domain-containing protein [Leadbettera azotonutricia]|uniref:Ig domain protein, group 2 domain protein n=1 Tax=Leadbettera azotonutricia (strain ATCC BAA-888 / DSM 13862 / ZAS-9) TaxID=545695 RepID=F5YD89_LEAAZ|nr:Ig-like domain-containing protein [Leadbettera azotonutricia]AEF82539.1 Ig domain protein, group 2 domain protein [Leadbettera azotonutricia ZAS-9]